VSWVAMCEFRSKEKTIKNKPKKEKTNDKQGKEMDCDQPHLTTNEKNAAHPVDRTANWWIGGCCFTLAPKRGARLVPSYSTKAVHSTDTRKQPCF